MKPSQIVFCSLVLLVGCDDGGGDGKFAVTQGQSVLVPSATEVTFMSLGGGYGPAPVPGAACDPGKYSYTIQFGLGHLLATLCRMPSPDSSATPASDDLTLTAPQLNTLKTAVEAVKVSNATTCGADAGLRELRVASASASQLYGDDFYACEKKYDVYVSFDALNDLSLALSTIDH